MTELLRDILLDSRLLELYDSESPTEPPAPLLTEPAAAPEVLLLPLVSGTVRVSPILLLMAL